jgi:cystathionine beta-synthase
VAGALKALQGSRPEDVAVVLLPDTGERYLSKVYNEAWMRDNGFLEPAEVRLAEVLAAKRGGLPALLTVDADRPVREAVDLVRRHDVSVIPVTRAGSVVGTVNENALMRLVLESPDAGGKPVGEVMEPPLPRLAPTDSVQAAIRVLAERTPAVLVYDGDRPVGILSRIDVIGFIST